MSTTLFENQTADGSSAWAPIISTGLVNLYVSGDLGGGTLTIEALDPGSNIVVVDGGVITTAGMHLIEAGSFKGRAVLTGSAAANVNAYIEVENVKTRLAVRLRV